MTRPPYLYNYARLLSISLFRLMEEGETFLLTPPSKTLSPAKYTAPKHIDHIERWLSLLARLDTSLPQTAADLLLQKGKTIRFGNLEDMSNAAALTLMMLDDHYQIFSHEPEPLFSSGQQASSQINPVAQLTPNILPVFTLQDITPDTMC